MRRRNKIAMLAAVAGLGVACEQALVTDPAITHDRPPPAQGQTSRDVETKLEKVRSIAQGCSFSVATRDGKLRTVAVAVQRLPFELPRLVENGGRKVGGRVVELDAPISGTTASMHISCVVPASFGGADALDQRISISMNKPEWEAIFVRLDRARDLDPSSLRALTAELAQVKKEALEPAPNSAASISLSYSINGVGDLTPNYIMTAVVAPSDTFVWAVFWGFGSLTDYWTAVNEGTIGSSAQSAFTCDEVCAADVLGLTVIEGACDPNLPWCLIALNTQDTSFINHVDDYFVNIDQLPEGDLKRACSIMVSKFRSMRSYRQIYRGNPLVSNGQLGPHGGAYAPLQKGETPTIHIDGRYLDSAHVDGPNRHYWQIQVTRGLLHEAAHAKLYDHKEPPDIPGHYPEFPFLFVTQLDASGQATELGGCVPL